MKIVLATHNEDKCAEMSALLSSFPIEILTLEDFPKIGEIIDIIYRRNSTMLRNFIVLLSLSFYLFAGSIDAFSKRLASSLGSVSCLFSIYISLI